MDIPSAELRAALAAYHGQLEHVAADRGKRGSSLVQDDQWLLHELRDTVASRDPGYLTQSELARVLRWKLAKGKFRPALVKYVSELTDEAVRAASEKALGALGSADGGVIPAIKALSELRGVGPATASAVVAAVAPSEAPFMADELLMALYGERKYTLTQYRALVDDVKAECARRNEAEDLEMPGSALPAESDWPSAAWSPQLFQLAVWAHWVQAASAEAASAGSKPAAAQASSDSARGAPAAGKKRGRAARS